MQSSEATSAEKARIIEASKELQNKVGTGSISEKVVEKAQKVITENKVDFAPIAKPHMDELRSLIAEANASKIAADDKGVIEKMMVPIMNIKANAGTFNYPVISGLTGIVLTFMEDVKVYDRKIVQVADILHKTILLALARKMSGDAGRDGKALQTAFQELCQNCIKKLNG